MRKTFLSALLCFFYCAVFAQDAEMRIRLVETAKKYLGTPYIYGSQSPKAFDCSGFIGYVYREVLGIELERSSRGMFATGTSIDAKSAQPGDVFIYDTVGGRPSHVSMYIGDGKIIHAVSEGPKTGVIISAVDDRYFGPRQIASRLYLAAGKNGPQVAASAATSPSATTTPSAPAKPSAVVPAKQAASADVVDIGFVIPKEKTTFTDKIPAQVGTSISFTARNGTGAEGTFIVIFYKTDKNFSSSKELRQEKITLKKDGKFEIPAYTFVEPGVYKLIVKSGGMQLVERIFSVTEK